MGMYVDLCFDAFEEKRELTWKNVLKKQNEDPFWVARNPKPVEPEKPKVEAPKKKKRGKALRIKKVVEYKPLAETLWFL